MTHRCEQCDGLHDPELSRCPIDLEYERGYRSGYKQGVRDSQAKIERLQLMNDDKFRHLEAYRAAATADKAEIERLTELLDIAGEMAGHITRPIALGMPFDRDVLRHWAHCFHEAKRAAKAAGGE